MKKVLIITYYWPPGGGAGVYRVLKFVKYFSLFNWRPVVLTIERGSYPVIDHSLEKDIPSNCTVYKCKSFEPFGLYKKFVGRHNDELIPDYVFDSKSSIKDLIARWIRLNLFVPDARMGWIPSAVTLGQKIIKTEHIDLIFTSSPPHTVQVIANLLARKTGIKWVADFRDPWTDVLTYQGTHRSLLAAGIDRHLEKSVLRRANAITCINQQYIDTFRQQAQNRYFKIPNGYDEDDFINVVKEPSPKFRIKYTGNLSETRNITNVLSALNNIDSRIRSNIELSFYGFVDPKVQKKILEMHLMPIIKINSYVPHCEAIRHMVNTEILLLVIHEVIGNKGIMTGKIFEYARSYNFILAIGPKDGEAAQFLKKTASGRIFDYQEDLTDIILQQYKSWINKETHRPNIQEIKKYSRMSLTKKMVDIFQQLDRETV